MQATVCKLLTQRSSPADCFTLFINHLRRTVDQAIQHFSLRRCENKSTSEAQLIPSIYVSTLILKVKLIFYNISLQYLAEQAPPATLSTGMKITIFLYVKMLLTVMQWWWCCCHCQTQMTSIVIIITITFFFFSNATTCSYELRGFPSLLWL